MGRTILASRTSDGLKHTRAEEEAKGDWEQEESEGKIVCLGMSGSC